MDLDTNGAPVRCGNSVSVAPAAAQYNLYKPEIPALSLATLGFDPAYIMPRLWRFRKIFRFTYYKLKLQYDLKLELPKK
ncbi:MAG: hypothetical protein ACI9S8_001438 [Chlamydiales bacterium]|jgi:hypothetical protein